MSLLRATSVISLVLAFGAAGTLTFTPAELRAFFTWVSTPGLGLAIVTLVLQDFLTARRAARMAASRQTCCGCPAHR